MTPGPKNAKSILKLSKNSTGQIVQKIKILRASYEVKACFQIDGMSLLPSNSDVFSYARPWKKFGDTLYINQAKRVFTSFEVVLVFT